MIRNHFLINTPPPRSQRGRDPKREGHGGASCKGGMGVVAVLNRMKGRTANTPREKNKPRPQKISLWSRVGHL